jgi:hypothetical protein
MFPPHGIDHPSVQKITLTPATLNSHQSKQPETKSLQENDLENNPSLGVEGMTTPIPSSAEISVKLGARVSDSSISDKTLANYGSNIRRILKLVPGDLDDPSYPPEKEYAKALATIAPASRSTVAGAIARWVRLNPDANPLTKAYVEKELADAFISRTAARPDPNIPTERQAENHVMLNQLTKVLNDRKKALRTQGVLHGSGSLPRQLYDELRLWVVGCLYLEDPDNPPRRLEYRSMRIISEKDWLAPPYNGIHHDGNWLIITGRTKKRFVINDYKTAATYGPFMTRVGKALNSVINVWLKYHRGEFLLGDHELTAVQMTRMINECFVPTGKIVGANALRHAVLSELFPADAVQRHRIAALMGHSVSTQMEYPLRAPEVEKGTG